MTDLHDSERTATGELRARPGVWSWLRLLLFVGLILVSAVSYLLRYPVAESSLWTALLACAAVFLWGLHLIRLAREVVIADEHGLRWRDRDGWHSVDWAEVTDFYEGGTPSIHWLETTVAVETSAGRFEFRSGWRGYDELWALIAERATSARAHAEGWRRRGERRTADFPQEFRYSGGTDWGLVAFGTAFLVAGAWVWLAHLWRHFWEVGTLAGGAPPLTPGLWLFLLVAPAGVACCGAAFAARGRREERIFVDEEGIRFEDEGSSVQIPWEEVTAWRPAKRSPLTDWELVTRRGTFRCGVLLGDFDLLNKLIQHQLRGRAPGERA